MLIASRHDLHDIPYASRYEIDTELPKYKMPETGCEPKVAYQLLHDELILGEFWLCEPRRALTSRWEPQHELGLVSSYLCPVPMFIGSRQLRPHLGAGGVYSLDGGEPQQGKSLRPGLG